jgi:hypothetical protein
LRPKTSGSEHLPTPIARPTSITSTANRTNARYVELAAVFQDQLLEEPPSTGASAAPRRRRLALITIAKAACCKCPLITDCLDRAVVAYDVAGYVAGTTPPQSKRHQRRERRVIFWGRQFRMNPRRVPLPSGVAQQ